MQRSSSLPSVADPGTAGIQLRVSDRPRRHTDRWLQWQETIFNRRHMQSSPQDTNDGVQDDVSSRASVGSGTSITSHRLQAATEIASVTAKLKFLEEEAKLKLDLKRLQLKRDLETAHAKLEAAQVEEASLSGSASGISHTVGSYLSSAPGVGDPTGSLSSSVTGEATVVPLSGSPPGVIPPVVPLSGSPPGVIPPVVPLSGSPPGVIPPVVPLSGSPPGVIPPVVPLSGSPPGVIPPVVPLSGSPPGVIPPVDPLSGSTPGVFVSSPYVGVCDMGKFVEQMSWSRLPVPEPGIFSGDPLNYPGWIAAFETLVERRAIPPEEKLYYLQKYLKGEAREAVEGFFLLGTEFAYDRAKTLLQKRYGNSFVIANAFRDRLDAWPRMQSSDGLALRKLSDFLRQCEVAMNTISSLRVLNDDRENRKILQKLPDWLITRWSRFVVQHKEAAGVFPPFAEFVRFMERESEIALDPVTSLHSLKRSDRHVKKDVKNVSVRTLSTTVNSTQQYGNSYTRQTRSCPLCDKQHNLDDCEGYLKKSLEQRKWFIRDKALCFGCLIPGHRSKDCKRRMTCKICKKKHPTSLHVTIMNESNNTVTRPKSGITHFNSSGQGNTTMIVPVWLSHCHDPDKEELVYALLDTQSDTTFILDSVAKSLGLSGTEACLRLSTMSTTNELIHSCRYTGLTVRAHDSSLKVPLPKTFSRRVIPANRTHIPTPEMAKSWRHLEPIAANLMPVNSCVIGILIGYNCPRALMPRDVLLPPGESDAPYALKTDLGWSVVGHMNLEDEDFTLDEVGTSHHIVLRELPSQLVIPTKSADSKQRCREKVVFSFQNRIKEVVDLKDVTRMIELDFSEKISDETSLSQEDRKFLHTLSSGICKPEGSNHYEIPLPFREPLPELPSNKSMAVNRLKFLKRKFERNSKFKDDYCTFMKEVIDKGYAEKVPLSEVSKEDGHTWYIPHHGVYHPKKPDRIRVVFDCSAKYDGVSLNDVLLSGPDQINSLIGVLCRFRQESVAFMCDIEKMFYQFMVKDDQRDYFRFVWWQDGNCQSEPAEYRMTVHLFGAISSPGCANFGLKRTADDGELEYGVEAAKFVRNNFYVDDGLVSVPTVDQALKLFRDSQDLCANGGLRLHKFVSNSVEVMEAIDPADRAKGIKDLDLYKDSLPIERVLGIQWCIQSDVFQFKITLDDRPRTRRGILSIISSIYDPLGLISPLLLEGKMILQELCRAKFDWDTPLPDGLSHRWDSWCNDLISLEKLKIPRCLKPHNFGVLKHASLHHFSDASTLGYGHCSYLRLVDDKGLVHCSLVMAKSRVAPLKVVTIPRLELSAAVVSARVSVFLRKELEYDDLEEVFWSDSKVVLGYIRNESRRFHVFVANRVQQIRDRSEPSQWRYIESEENPADVASRGTTSKNLVKKSGWFRGPDLLWEDYVPAVSDDHEDFVIGEADVEVKKCQTLATTCRRQFDIGRFEYFSSWKALVRAVALCRLYMFKLRAKVSPSRVDNPTRESTWKLTVHDLEEAERVVVQLIQQSYFSDELSILRNIGEIPEDRKSSRIRNRMLKKSSSLHRLDPFVDRFGLIRVGGRLTKSAMEMPIKHPVVIPKTSHVTELIVRHFHQKICHQGRGYTLNKIRENGFWILHGCAVVSNFLRKCVECRRLRSIPQDQRMANLPEDRLIPSPPFTYCGVDYFGPWLVKEGRKELKRYGVLFTCLSSRAVHIETSNSMDTSSFINALRRFLALRGPIRELRSDRGTNFVGAERELGTNLDEMDQERIRNFLLDKGCDFLFKMNPPASSHMGGVWERQIRSVRSILNSLLYNLGTHLDDEGFRTFMLEVSAILNSRPLTVESLNDPSLRPLTPQQLLTMKSEVLMPPPGNFQRPDLYAVKRWRRVQFLANSFWDRWRKEYLQSLQVRQKWVHPKRNFETGDVVIIKDDSTNRSQWRLAKICDTRVSSDGLVRSVKLVVGDRNLDKKGRRLQPPTVLERPIHN